MNVLSPIATDDITARKILITLFNLSAPPVTAGEMIALHGDEAYPIFARRLAHSFRGNRDINQIWSETLGNMFSALTEGMEDDHPMVKGIHAGLSRRDERVMNDALAEAEFQSACRALGIDLTPVS